MDSILITLVSYRRPPAPGVAIGGTDAVEPGGLAATGSDFRRKLYRSIVASEMRSQLGKHHTPRDPSELAVAELGVDCFEPDTVLDLPRNHHG